MSTPSSGSGTPTTRLHGLDAVRAIALLLVVTMHTTLSFIPGGQGWFVGDDDRSLTMAIAAYTMRMCQMSLFFLVAGFFTRDALRRLGGQAFVKDRLRRIALPLAIAWPITMVMLALILTWIATHAGSDGQPAPSRPRPTFRPDDFPLAHLWFLWVLLQFYAAMLVLLVVFKRWDPHRRVAAVLDRVIRFLVTTRLTLWLALPLALALFNFDGWKMAQGMPTPHGSLILSPTAWLAYGSPFALGWYIHRQPVLLEVWQKRWPLNLAVAVVATLFCLAMLRPGATPSLADNDGLRFAYALVFVIGAWSWTFSVIGMGLRFLSGFSPVRRYAADASYWVYLAHLPLIILLQFLVSRLPWPWFVKFPLILLLGGVVLFGSYQLLVRYTFIGAILGGRRRSRPSSSP